MPEKAEGSGGMSRHRDRGDLRNALTRLGMQSSADLLRMIEKKSLFPNRRRVEFGTQKPTDTEAEKSVPVSADQNATR